MHAHEQTEGQDHQGGSLIPIEHEYLGEQDLERHSTVKEVQPHQSSGRSGSPLIDVQCAACETTNRVERP
jgi:hypothetical protein